MSKFEIIGMEQALEAIDQVGSYENLEDALDSYFVNMGDTLTEMGFRDWCKECEQAHRGFALALRNKGITYIPHGLDTNA